QHFKKFLDANQIWIESTGATGDRIRGYTVDIAFYDECFPYNQKIETNKGKMPIGKLFDLFNGEQDLPLIKSFNEEKEIFEYKKVTNAWKREGKKDLLKIKCD